MFRGENRERRTPGTKFQMKMNTQNLIQLCATLRMNCLNISDTILLAMVSHGQVLTLTTLAETLRMSQPGVTKIVEKLEANGLVRRHVCKCAPRSTGVLATDEGNAFITNLISA